MKNDLIYIVAVGNEHCCAADQLIKSLREHHYTGTIAVLATEDLCGDAQFVRVSEQFLKEVHNINNRSESVFLRTKLLKFFPHALNFDYILYLDTDVRAVRDVDILMGDPDVRHSIGAMSLHLPMVTKAANFTAMDVKKAQKTPLEAFSACMVGFPGGRIGEQFLDLWDFESEGRRGDDETALNAVLLRRYAAEALALPKTAVYRRYQPESGSAVLVHGIKPAPREAPSLELGEVDRRAEICKANTCERFFGRPARTVVQCGNNCPCSAKSLFLSCPKGLFGASHVPAH